MKKNEKKKNNVFDPTEIFTRRATRQTARSDFFHGKLAGFFGVFSSSKFTRRATNGENQVLRLVFVSMNAHAMTGTLRRIVLRTILIDSSVRGVSRARISRDTSYCDFLLFVSFFEP